jgi:hypothetical protein
MTGHLILRARSRFSASASERFWTPLFIFEKARTEENRRNFRKFDLPPVPWILLDNLALIATTFRRRRRKCADSLGPLLAIRAERGPAESQHQGISPHSSEKIASRMRFAQRKGVKCPDAGSRPRHARVELRGVDGENRGVCADVA